MPTAEDKHYTRFDESLLDDGDFCDTGMLRRCIGNLNHLADQVSQNRIKWVLPAGGSPFLIDSDLTASADTYFSDALDGVVFPLMLWRSPAFDLHIRESRQSYRCRISLRFHSSHATHKATLRAVLAPVGFAAEQLAVNGVNVVQSTPTESTTLAWENLSTLAYLNEEVVRRATSTVPIRDTVGGAFRNATWIRVELMIAGSIANIAGAPALGGVELTEYLPP